jgi:LmbE family N-acetylglucosaminyl deacetylase
VKTVLSFGAHPDDIEIGCGGTEALFLEKGYEIVHAVLTSGEAGGRSLSVTELAKVRESEAIEGARALGVKRVDFFRYPDGLTHYTREMKVEIIRYLRKVRPEIVFIHTSQDRFPDHRIAHDLVMSAVQAASGPWYPEIVEPPHMIKAIYGYEVWNPILEPHSFVDISSVIDKKMQAVRGHASQLTAISYDESFLGLARYRGAMGAKSAYAEAFEVLKCEVSLGAPALCSPL